MLLNGKAINLLQLRDEARAAAALPPTGELGTFEDHVFTYDAWGNPVDLNPTTMRPVIDSHVAMRDLTDAELYEKYGIANNKIPPDAATMQHVIAQVQGLAPRDKVKM